MMNSNQSTTLQHNQSNIQSSSQVATTTAATTAISNINSNSSSNNGTTSTGPIVDFKNYPNAHWYFTKEQIQKHYGDDVKSEITSRQASCAFIQDLGIKLKLSQLIIATATTYFHRFFIRHQLKDHDRFVIATTCLFLAGKVEEKPRKLLDVSYFSYKARYKNAELAQNSPEVGELANKIVQCEHLLLTTIAFELTVEHPYKYLLEYMKMIQGSKNLCQVAWNFVNDSLRTNLCLRYPPDYISYASVFLATKFLNYPLATEGKKQWWENHNIKLEVLEDISNQILDLYESTTNILINNNNNNNNSNNNNNGNGNSSISPKKQTPTKQQQNSVDSSTTHSHSIEQPPEHHHNSQEKIASPSSKSSTPSKSNSSNSVSSATKFDHHSPTPNSYQSPTLGRHQSLSPGPSNQNSPSPTNKTNRYSPYNKPRSRSRSPSPNKHKRDTRDNRERREDKREDRVERREDSKAERR